MNNLKYIKSIHVQYS